MKKDLIYTVLTFVMLAATGVLIFVALNPQKTGSQSGNNPELESITQKAGEIEVTVTPIQTGKSVNFEIQLETHSVELTYEMEKITTLKTKTGLVKPVRWEGDLPGGHHRKGALVFPDISGKPEDFVLIIENIDGKTLEYRWND